MRRDIKIDSFSRYTLFGSRYHSYILSSGHARITEWAVVQCLILHIATTRPMHYVLCIMYLISLRPMVGPMQMLCNKRIMHHYIMHYEKVDCNCIIQGVTK